MKTLGGGSRGKYRYQCEDAACTAEWQQTPPHKRTATESLQIVMKKSGEMRKYRCGRCGALKRGHICSTAAEDGVSALELDASDSAFQVMQQQPVPFQSYHANAAAGVPRSIVPTPAPFQPYSEAPRPPPMMQPREHNF